MSPRPEFDRVPESVFVYVTFIRTTPEALWTALTDRAPGEAGAF